ncbi:hypothetical protein DID99_34270 [Burkholderia sp. Bp8986]|nr:hypothetical protein DID99_34270 [Burkholderia sp. Bp8986]
MCSRPLYPQDGLAQALTDGQYACPPEDVGGVPGYADFLEAITDPMHEAHEHFLEWCGVDPAAFDLVLANQRLSEVKF